jgi:GTP cyclohydrolase II
MHVPSRVIRPQAEGAPLPEVNADQPAVWVASAPVPTKFGTFHTHVFRAVEDGEEKEHVALVFGDISGGERIAVRVHSECMTSEVFGSLKCDCKEQLEAAMQEIARRGRGAVLYLRQEGRGIGLANKIRAYELQSRGHDTVDANRLLGLPDDAREYDAAKAMLDHFEVKSITLLTNNPEKVQKLTALGVTIASRDPVLIAPNDHSMGYLEAKRLRMAHVLPHLRLTGSDGE